MAEHTVKVATKSDEDGVIAVLMLAFASDPMARSGWTEPRMFVANFPSFARAFGGGAFAHGSAHYVEGYSGAALWLPPDVHPDGATLFELMQRTTPADKLEQTMALFEQMAGYHPTEPHWYLPMIGVDPARQGQGVGSALLRHATAIFDRDRVPAYLESSNPKNVPLYERHGFEVLGEIQAGESPTGYPMLRRPR